jgi:hypothetical protein
MKAAIALFTAASLFAASALAAGGPKPKICFTKAEENAEMIVRAGLRLREGAAGCDGRPYEAHTQPLWDQVDQKFGPRFKQQTDIRRGAFVREFAKDAENNERAWDGRTVLYFRNYPLSQVYCVQIKQTLEKTLKGGWASFVTTARLYRIPVQDDYKPCG